VCGGRSIIEGTRIPFWSIIKWYKTGMSIEEILKGFPVGIIVKALLRLLSNLRFERVRSGWVIGLNNYA